VGRRASEVAVELLPAGEEGAAVRLLAAAFADNPLNLAVIRRHRRARRERSNAWGLAAQLPLARRRSGVLAGRLGGTLAGVLVAAAPWAHPFPAPSLARRVITAFGQGLGAAERGDRVYEALLARRPAGPHWYLSLLGVRSESRRVGVGGALLAAWLDGVDRAGGAA
jgi:ribosomal protein S18 acetylase RimI-like enzyme